MPIKRQGAAAAPKGIKRVAPQTTDDGPSKEDLEGNLLIITLKDYDEAFATNYGPGPRAVVDIIDLDDGGQRHESVWLFGNCAKQIAKGLGLDETGLGRLGRFQSKAGNTGWGFDFSEDDAEYARADAVFTAPF